MTPVWTPVANDGAGGGVQADSSLSKEDYERGEKLRDWLMDHAAGQENGKRVVEVAEAIKVSDRKIRTLVTVMRSRSWPICGTPETGYFWPQTRREAESTLAFLNARLRSTGEVRDGVRRGLDVAFGELDPADAQMELEL